MGQEKILKPVKSASGAAAFGESQRAELVAKILSKAPRDAAVSNRMELLSTLLSDTGSLSHFIRSAGLSEEMGAALLREAKSATQQAVQLSPRSIGEINEVLARIRPTVGGVDDSYGATASFGEVGSQPTRPHSPTNKINSTMGGSPDVKAAHMQFVVFSPEQADFDRTIDNIWSGAERGEDFKAPPNPAGIPPLNRQWDGIGISSETFYLILVSLAGALLFGIYVFVR